jgi:hypothetical protein
MAARLPQLPDGSRRHNGSRLAIGADIIGFGAGGGIAVSGKIHEPPGLDDVT